MIKSDTVQQKFVILTRKELPRTISSTLVPGGGAASLLEAKPTDEEVDIFDKSEDKEDTLGQEDGDEDKGSAEDTDKLEVEVRLGLDSSAAFASSFFGLQLDSSLICWGSRLLEDIKVLITKSSNTRTMIEPKSRSPLLLNLENYTYFCQSIRTCSRGKF